MKYIIYTRGQKEPEMVSQTGLFWSIPTRQICSMIFKGMESHCDWSIQSAKQLLQKQQNQTKTSSSFVCIFLGCLVLGKKETVIP